jgi:transaldolase
MTKIFADGANLGEMIEAYNDPLIQGLTTNPTLMFKAGITNYEEFAHKVLDVVKDKPVSFEVFSDDFEEMFKQAKKISSWANNVYVKIPVTNTEGKPTYDLIKRLSKENVKLNVTAIMTIEQITHVSQALGNTCPSIISVFAGRIADSGRDPEPYMDYAVSTSRYVGKDTQEVLWASPREAYNYIQAEKLHVDIITMTNSLIQKVKTMGKTLENFSLETVQMFRNDAIASGFEL